MLISVENSQSVIFINDICALLWKLLENPASEDELVDVVLHEYDVDAETAKKDVKSFIEFMTKNRIICI